VRHSGIEAVHRNDEHRSDERVTPYRPPSEPPDAKLARENALLRAEVARLRALALTDPLTGLPNRRYLDERLAAEVTRAARFHQSLSVLVIDVDDFKRVNDVWGHHKGDEVLVWIARFLRSQLRGIDVVCRTGGDEFVAILPETSNDGAAALAMRIVDTLARLRQGSGSDDHPIKISVGHASLGPGTGDPESLVSAADQAMYRCKARAKHQRRRARSA
jgi:two-component system cell cycle response regulator